MIRCRVALYLLPLLSSWAAAQLKSIFDIASYNFSKSSGQQPSSGFVSSLQNASFVSINRFLTEDELNLCQKHLQSSNQNGDFELNAEEYSIFIEMQSDGQIAEPFAEMDLILIATFYGVACHQCYGATQSDSCCVGDSAAINIRRSDAADYEQTTRFLCATVQQAINDVLGVPTAAPTPAAATAEPTLASQSPTAVPTPTPSSAAATNAPSGSPPPSAGAATSEPTVAPTGEPTSSPTLSPTKEPTAKPTRAPVTSKPTSKPTKSPLAAPTTAPTSFPLKDVSCVTFFYSIQNSAGFTADDILNENGNTLKTGLEVATWTTLVDILNATNSSSTTTTNGTASSSPQRRVYEAFLARRQAAQAPAHPALSRTLDQTDEAVAAAVASFYSSGIMRAMDLAMSDYFGLSDSGRLLDYFLFGLYAPLRHSQSRHRRRRSGDRRLRWLQQRGVHLPRRHLAYATAALPPNITNVINDPFCPQPDQAALQCAIVVTDACVVLEEGDVEADVQQTVLDGFEAALDDGAFFARVPPENLIP